MLSTRATRRGFTLVEMLVASVMGVLFLGLLYGSFLPVLDVSSASSSKVDTLGAATTALYQLEADIRVSTTAGLTVGSSTSAPVTTLGSTAETTEIAINVPEQFANTNDNYGQFIYEPNTGLSAWRSYVVYALVSETNGGSCDSADPCDLWRTTYDTGASSLGANPIGTTTLANVVASITTSGRMMARNVTSLQIANQTITCAGCPANLSPRPEVDLEMAVQSTDHSGKVSQSSYQTQVFVRNN